MSASESVPGTELLYDNGDRDPETSRRLQNLQHVRHGDGHIILVPQPSLHDPNDPLRWSTAKKWTTFLNGVFYAFIGSVTGPLVAAGMIPLSEFFGVSLQMISYSNGANLACQGVATTIWMPFAVKYGRRPIYFFSNILMGVACVWLALASRASYTPYLVGRAFLGIWQAPIESIVPSTVTDLFFLHDRGAKVSIYGLSVLGGNELGPLLSAFIIQSLGVAWSFWIMGIVVFVSCVAMFFSMPETLYMGPRPSIRALTAGVEEKSSRGTSMSGDTESPSGNINDQHSGVKPVEKRTYLSELKFWGLNDPNVNLLHAFLRPFILFTYPTVLWACIVYGFSLSWNVILGATVAQLFAPPPYNFDSSAQGLIFVSPLIGSLIGTYICGPLADRIANTATRRNGGIREPEMRLPTCAIAATLTFFGVLITSLTYTHQTHWIGPLFGIGVFSTGAQMGATLSMSYVLDCHRELSVELMVSVAALKSLIAWIWTWVVNDWIERDGMMVVYMSIAAINVAVYLTTIVLYIYGKRLRVWIHSRDLLGELGLRDRLGR
ncbi:MFS general substrate transporter [Pseudovirgaria hyperparasitica]|uniref:MFS general substrate transporter n=1 Tax=Pseudovirgaria hyperparasitica TaxID=470096 RepID=A0A6A6WL56_9PEZI|nr:MFS general substrate transporter [Pseudovirgaria hyperparasitica]KAF2762902.1 MFS general substrate transporter [Pseudovirgaria hyperparasitica]